MARAGTKRVVGKPGATDTEGTKGALVAATVDALREVGLAGASAREIARRAGCNQGLVFYHFGSVTTLLLAALDSVSTARRVRYHDAVDGAPGLSELVDVAAAIFEEDLNAGYIAVLVEMIGGASSIPGLGAEVRARIAPWRAFTADAVRRSLGESPLAHLVTPDELAHAIVALYLGLEMLAHLDDDRAPALALFDRARQLAGLVAALAPPAPTKESP